MKKHKIKLGVLALVCLALVGLLACGSSSTESEQQIVEVTRGDIVVSIAADGNVSLLKHQRLTFGTAGTIAQINVEEGDRVTEGQELARLDTTPLEQAQTDAELAVKSAEIDLEAATNSYNQLTTPYPYLTFQFVIPESVDSIRAAQQQIKEAQEEFTKGLSGEQYSMAKIKEQLRRAQENLEEAETKLAWGLGAGIRPSSISYWTLRAAQLQVDKAQLAVDIAKNNLSKVKKQLENAVIVAPFDGVVARVDAKEGDMLSTVNYATRTIIELIDPSRMELDAEVDEIDIPEVELGQKAVLTFDALPDVKLAGSVTSISPLATEEAGLVQYEVKISFDVPEDSGLKAGMTASADIISSERSNILLVPDRAIMHDSSGNTVVHLVVNGQIEERTVATGISDGIQTEIVDGLVEGDKVVVETKARAASSGLSF